MSQKASSEELSNSQDTEIEHLTINEDEIEDNSEEEAVEDMGEEQQVNESHQSEISTVQKKSKSKGPSDPQAVLDKTIKKAEALKKKLAKLKAE